MTLDPKLRHSLVVGGVSIGHFSVTAGTLGGVVWDKVTGESLLLSNLHVFRAAGAIFQPGPADGGKLATDVVGMYHRGPELTLDSPNPIDAAVALKSGTRPVDSALPRKCPLPKKSATCPKSPAM